MGKYSHSNVGEMILAQFSLVRVDFFGKLTLALKPLCLFLAPNLPSDNCKFLHLIKPKAQQEL